MTEKPYVQLSAIEFQEVIKIYKENEQLKKENEKLKQTLRMVQKRADKVYEENEQLKIRNKGKQAFINKQDKIIKILYNQCKDFKEMLDDCSIPYPIDERLDKFFEEGVKL